MSFGYRDRLIAVATPSGQIRIWNATTGALAHEYDAHYRPAAAILSTLVKNPGRSDFPIPNVTRVEIGELTRMPED